MGASKSELFTPEQNRMAALAKAVAHPARIAILQYLIQRGECVCGDLVEVLPLSQATVSQHLKAMKEAGIIKGNIEGKYTCYCLDAEVCGQLSAGFTSLMACVKSGCC